MTHESGTLNRLVEKVVDITFWDGSEDRGVLFKNDNPFNGKCPYGIHRGKDGDLLFYKSNIKKIQEISFRR